MGEIIWPINGRSSLQSPVRQKVGTTDRGKNVRTRNPTTGQLTGGQRSGLKKLSPTYLAADRSPVRHIAEVVHDNPANVYTALDDAALEEQKVVTLSALAVELVRKDKLGNIYVSDGATSITKYNPHGAKQWKQNYPAPERGARIRSFVIDDNFQVYAAVSDGGDPAKARIWGHAQIEDNKLEQIWELKPGYFTEALWLDGTTLYAAQNNPLLWQSRVAAYNDLGVENPTEVQAFKVPYPVNDGSSSTKDNLIVLSHEPKSDRGAFPRSPGTTATSEDWTLELLTDFGSRVWSAGDVRDIDGDGSFNSEYLDGDVIPAIRDRTGNFRDWVALGSGGILRKNVLAGNDTIFLDGTTAAYQGYQPVTTDFQYRQLNRSILPAHKGHQFVLFLLVRTSQSTTRSTIFNRAFTNTANTKDQRLYANASWFTSTFQNASGSAFLYEEIPTTGTGFDAGWGRTASANHNVPLGGAFGEDGVILLTYVFDHGIDDQVLNPTRSCLRINGRPIDRWKSETGHETLAACSFGIDLFLNGSTGGNRFKGDILAWCVLSDHYKTSASGTAALERQRLIEMPIYPDSLWASGSRTEIERIEGMMMHGFGFAHLLPSGHQATLEAVGIPNNGDTVLVGGQTYKFTTAPLAAAYDVLRDGSSGTEHLRRLHHAINGTGARGADYHSGTPVNDAVWSPGVLENDGTNARGAMMVQVREARGTTHGVLDENTSEARLAWLPIVGGAGTNASVRTRTASATVPGIYPHPYFLVHTADSVGGPPSSTSQASIFGALASPYGMLTIWDPINGRLLHAATSDGPETQDLPVAAVGYGHVCLSDGSIVTTGPRQAADVLAGFVAENLDVRKIVIVNGQMVIGFGTTAELGWGAAPGEQTHKHLRLAVDRWDNAYVPLFPATGGPVLAVYTKLAATNTVDGSLLYTVSDLDGSPRAYSVEVDPTDPEYPTDWVNPRAERLYLGVEVAGGEPATLRILREVSVASSGLPSRTVARYAIAGGELHKIDLDGTDTTVDANFLDPDATFIDSTTLYGVRYYTDGTNYRLVDPKKNLTGGWRALRGAIPPRFQLMERYRKKVCLARGPNPHRIVFSQHGDALGWDFDPPGNNPLEIAAIDSSSDKLGDFGSPITCIAALRDDLLAVGGERQLALIRGDPGQGGQYDNVVKGIGVAFGRARCFLPDNRFLFMTDQAELMLWDYTGKPENLSIDNQEAFLSTFDFSKGYVELFYDPDRRAVCIFQFPRIGVKLRSWTLELDTMALWEDDWSTLGIHPTAACLLNGDDPLDRQAAIGNWDGILRCISPTAASDDGSRINSEVLLRLNGPNDQPVERLYEHLNVLLTKEGDARYEFYASLDPDDLGLPQAQGDLEAGHNHPGDVRVAGAFCALLLASRLSGNMSRWGLHRATVDARKTGRQVGT